MAVFRGDSRIDKTTAQHFNIRALQSEMPQKIRRQPMLFDRAVNIQAVAVEPDAAAAFEGLRLGDFAQAQKFPIEVACGILAPGGIVTLM